ncbi:MAG: sodium/proton-translocating pyrophosphatase [Zavarzinella sp.]
MPLKIPGLQSRKLRILLHVVVVIGAAILLGAAPQNDLTTAHTGWQPFATFFDTTHFSMVEQLALLGALLTSCAAIVYAAILSKKVFRADSGTSGMQAVADAVRKGANEYMKKQFRIVSVLLVILAVLIIVAKWPFGDSTNTEVQAIAASRGIAFLIGAIFSATVGFFGMKLATEGNLRVASAARLGMAPAMRLGYQTGTVTGMLTTGLGLLGGCVIVLFMGEKAYETLLGFAFGGSLLALFMRVGGGIYTKAADVGADLVGKIEQDIPEDDPRNAATIADNVGDNVGDCAGMAADVFESYTVTMVAAMILGYAAFGTKAMILPLLFQAVGILSSMISTALVGKKDPGPGAGGAMAAINNSFRIGALLTVAGIFLVGFLFLRFEKPYIVEQAIERGLVNYPEFRVALGLQENEKNAKLAHEKWRKLSEEEQNRIAEIPMKITTKEGVIERSVFEEADSIVPVKHGLDIRPAVACLVGILLTLALMFKTEYWTSTEYSPVRSITKNSRTGDATNIIQGIAIGYESTVWAVLLIAVGIFTGVYVYSGAESPIFTAYGIAMCGIGMLALTGDTLSMDVFGPVADNANGIGEMGYNRDTRFQQLSPTDPEYMSPAAIASSRQILTDLDATGNTTKAITKGIAIGSAVVAAVSLFASFIAVLVKGSEEKINEITKGDFAEKTGLLSIAVPEVFIGMLLGGAVPFLFSSMTIRAVSRAAYLIVNECRNQFKKKEIWEGTEPADYARVVGICTTTAQRELIGPGLLAIFAPILVGFLLGPYALGGFLAGMMVVGQLLAVFMATAGGAWDNAKKMIEDQEPSDLSGKGSQQHKASVTGDTVGDPLKDTAGPAINPLIKVMNMVALLVLPLVLVHNLKNGSEPNYLLTAAIVLVGFLAISWSWWQSKRDTIEMRELDAEYEVQLKAAIEKRRSEKDQNT